MVIYNSLSFYYIYLGSAMLFPLVISAFGIIVCIFTSFVATSLTKVDMVDKIEATLKK